MAEQKSAKHVIFLGAGASSTSGYPLANDLRLLLSSRTHFEEFARAALAEAPQFETGNLLQSMKFFDAHKTSIDVFRNGGFASVDEFCKLSAGSKGFAKAVDDMRRLTMVVLGLHHPEREFYKSEYYQFVQKLFDRSLCSFREDVVVLSFNYDPYLEYLLLRALRYRCRISGRDTDLEALNAASGGFLDMHAWVKSTEACGFALLKLHGAIVQVQDSNYSLGHTNVLEKSSPDWLSLLCKMGPQVSNPWIVFPWELFDENGTFINAKTFPGIGNGSDDIAFRAFETTWKRAKSEVEAATKVSFIGISMHEYMEFGLKHLFEGKHGTFEVVMADPSNGPFTDTPDGGPAHRLATPAYRLRQLLLKVRPDVATLPHGKGNNGGDNSISVRCIPTFADFIRTEMN